MVVSRGEQENTLVENACALQDPIKVPAFITELRSVSGLDLVALYLRLESLYYVRTVREPMEAVVLYEILRELGQQPSPIKGLTISGAAEQRKRDVHGTMAGIEFS